MERHCASLLLVSLLVVAPACDQPADRADRAPEAPATQDEHDSGGHPADAHGAADQEGQALLPIMQRLGVEMTRLTHALMTDDHETVERSAAAIAEHAPISAAEIERLRRTLGPDMAAFEALDESVHVASVRLRDAARERRLDLVVERLGAVQRGCVACHAQFRERLRTTSARQ